jgi:outer membrane protein assembly factor BamE
MRKLIFLVLVTLLTSSCMFIYKQPLYQGNLLDKSAVDQLKQGMTQPQVIGLLGSPSVTDPFHHSRWDYVATERHKHHATEVKNLTLWFEGDTLNKWEGEYFPEQDSELSVEMRKFGNLPKDKKKGH